MSGLPLYVGHEGGNTDIYRSGHIALPDSTNDLLPNEIFNEYNGIGPCLCAIQQIFFDFD